MKLQELEIKLMRWGENKGQYEAVVSYADKSGEIKLLLDPELSAELLRHTGDAIRKYSARAADELRDHVEQSVEEARALPAITS